MDEERTAIQELVAIYLFPLVGGGPRRVARRRQGIRRRAETERIQEHGLVVAFPAVRQKAALWLPSMRDGSSAVARPLPIGAAVERVGQCANLPLVRTILIEIDCGGEHSREQEGGVNRGKLTVPGTPSSLHVEKVVVEPFVACRVRCCPLRAGPEDP